MTRTRAAVLAGALAALVLVACGGDPAPDELTITGAWARTTPAKAANGAAYLTITSPVDDSLVGVAVPSSVAAAAQVHTAMRGDDGGSTADMPGMDHGEEGGTTAMAPLDEVELPAGEAVNFEPGRLHIMLTGLVRGLEEGDTVLLTLRFQRAPDQTVELEVSTNAP